MYNHSHLASSYPSLQSLMTYAKVQWYGTRAIFRNNRKGCYLQWKPRLVGVLLRDSWMYIYRWMLAAKNLLPRESLCTCYLCPKSFQNPSTTLIARRKVPLKTRNRYNHFLEGRRHGKACVKSLIKPWRIHCPSRAMHGMAFSRASAPEKDMM